MAQIIIIMFKDLICKEKIPGMFIVSNNKLEETYLKIFNSVYDILTQNGNYDIKIKYIVTYLETGLANAVTLWLIIPPIMGYYHTR